MLNLNLLSPDEKIRLAYEMRRRAILVVGVSFWLILAVGFVLLLPTMFFLGFQKFEAVRTLELIKQNEAQSGLAADLVDINDVNHHARAVVHALAEARPVPAEITALFSSVPSGVALDGVSYRASSRQFSLQGTSATRDAFLALLDKLKHDSAITRISSPVSNVIQESDIKFTITAILK